MKDLENMDKPPTQGDLEGVVIAARDEIARDETLSRY